MFKYTPKESVLRDMTGPKTGNYWDKDYFKRCAVLKQHGASQDYTMNSILLSDFHKVCFYSKTKVEQVPVRGHLFPVSMFNEVEE